MDCNFKWKIWAIGTLSSTKKYLYYCNHFREFFTIFNFGLTLHLIACRTSRMQKFDSEKEEERDDSWIEEKVGELYGLIFFAPPEYK